MIYERDPTKSHAKYITLAVPAHIYYQQGYRHLTCQFMYVGGGRGVNSGVTLTVKLLATKFRCASSVANERAGFVKDECLFPSTVDVCAWRATTL